MAMKKVGLEDDPTVILIKVSLARNDLICAADLEPPRSRSKVRGWHSRSSARSAADFPCQEKSINGQEIANLMGEMDLEEAAEVSGCSCEAFGETLDR